MRFSIAFIAHLFLLSVLTTATMAAEPYQSRGVIRDATSDLIPGAAVTVREPGTGLTWSSQTDEQGVFSIALPAAGTYQVEIKAAGFTLYQTQIVLTSGAPSANLTIGLVVEANSETIEVTADALAAETTSTQLGESLDTKRIEAVPLNGRSFTDLMAVQPGIVPQNTAQPGAVIMTGVASTPPSGDANPGNLSISGQRESSNGFRVNGSDVEEDVNMGTSILPNLDAIDSFRVLTSNFDAEYGNSSGGLDTGNIAVPSAAEREGDFSQNALNGSVNGDNWATLLSARLGRTVTAGEPYSAVFPDGQIPQAAWSAPAKNLLTYIPQPNAGLALFATSAEAETLTDNKGALRADWTHGKGLLLSG